MEGTTLQPEDSISNSQVISKVTSVVPGSSTIPIIKATANGQQQTSTTVVLQAAAVPETAAAVDVSGGIVVSGHTQQQDSAPTIVSTISGTANNHNSIHHPQQPQQQPPSLHGAHKSVPTQVVGGATAASTVSSASSAQPMVSAGSMSIVQFQLPTPQTATMVQSVIQSNHQSVIQPTNPISAIQLPKNVILLNKLPSGSVIQSTESESNIQMVKEENEAVTQIYGDESKRRREILARRPSYRKILNDLSATEAAAVPVSAASAQTDTSTTNLENKTEEEAEQHQSPNANQTSATAISIPSYIKMLPSIQLGSQDGTSTIQTIPTIMTNANTGSSTIVQYAPSGHDGQFIVPDIQTYQLRPPGNSTTIAQNVVMTTQPNMPSHNIDEAVKKREMRLLKNREAAKECRRKKKEYIKCLENRVAVLENQNKALIDELKTLKELYCKKSD